MYEFPIDYGPNCMPRLPNSLLAIQLWQEQPAKTAFEEKANEET